MYTFDVRAIVCLSCERPLYPVPEEPGLSTCECDAAGAIPAWAGDHRYPITMLVRKFHPNRWERWGSYPNLASAEAEFKANISGKGVTAWTWWGPTEEAQRMLADPDYEAETDMTAQE